MFHIDNYINTPAACVAIALIVAVFGLTLIVYLREREERIRRRKVEESGRTITGTAVRVYDSEAE